MKLIRSVILAGLAMLGLVGAAQARDVYWSVGIDAYPGVSVGVSNARPVYVAPQPVYVAPAPVYVPPPRVYYQPVYQPVYVQPAPVYYGSPYYYGPRGKHKHKHHKHWHRG
jgi:hypothetical protein